ncbi:phosphatase PAP2 family protein [Ruegeria sp.]|uniref:phosphatase PAP2 family protein n=1 Tax=Ruegeria sp. TaxID=1879320 RepID=UPI0023207886|nr:phosphatase PAP2 family protein [Ruegeria sp.]MDA7966415.1 phosphatase PAP2 family protein [Ruegeria sp.]
MAGEVFISRHAGSPASPFLSTALNTSRDGLINYWDGRGRSVKPFPADASYLEDVRDPTKAMILDCELRSRLAVLGSANKSGSVTDGKAKLVYLHDVKGTPKSQILVKLKRPKEKYFKDQLRWVRAYADLRADRMPEIQVQLSDMLSFFGAHAYLDNGRRSKTLLYLSVTLSVAIHVAALMKYRLRQKRPIDYAAEVQPIIQTPDHSTFPAGHSIEAFAVATVLHRFMIGSLAGEIGNVKFGKEEAPLPFLLAHRIATNRVVAGVHFPIDCRAGAYIGVVLGELIYNLGASACKDSSDAQAEVLRELRVQKCNPKTKWGHSHDTPDFLLSDFGELSEKGDVTELVGGFAPLSIARHLWNEANQEW